MKKKLLKCECEFCDYFFELKDEIYFIINTPICPKCGKSNDVIYI